MYEAFKNLSKRKKIVILGILGSIVIGFFIVFKPSGEPVYVIKVEKQNFQHILKEEGITQVKEKYTIYSPVTGVMKRIQKKAGDNVAKGEILLIVQWDQNKLVRSPIDGKILKIYRSSEGPVFVQEKIMDIGDINHLELRSEILTEDLPNLNVGDKVLIHGFGEKVLEGRVSRIEPSAFTKISSLGVEEQRVAVYTEFPSIPGVGDGFLFQLSFVLEEYPNSIAIPTSCMFREGMEWFVYVVKEEKAVLRKITSPIQSQGMAMVTEGIEVGDEVIVFPGDITGEGVRVKVIGEWNKNELN